MTISVLVIIVLALSSIIGAVMVLKKSAKKFNLTDEQLTKIKQRNKELDKKERDEDNWSYCTFEHISFYKC